MKTSSTSELEKLLRPLQTKLSAELAQALVALHADPETQSRYDDLAERRTEGTLNPMELEELEALVRANTLLGLLQAEARSLLSHAESA